MTGPRTFLDEMDGPKRSKIAQEFGLSPEKTALTEPQERAFQVWVKKNGITDADHPESRYDYRGAYLAGIGSQVSDVDGLPHWPDTFKQHGHPTFSVESKYSQGPDDGGSWQGETFSPPKPKGISSRAVAALSKRSAEPDQTRVPRKKTPP